jgi:hypothetical protein
MSDVRNFRDRRIIYRMFFTLHKMGIMSSRMKDLFNADEYDFFVKKFSIRSMEDSITFLPQYQDRDRTICGIAIDFETHEVVCSWDESEKEWSYGRWYMKKGELMIEFKIKGLNNITSKPFVCPHKDALTSMYNYIDNMILSDSYGR